MGTVQIVRQFSASGTGYSLQSSEATTVSVDQLIPFQKTIAAAASNVQYIFPIDFSQLQFVWIKGENAMTIKTNSSGSPTDTITLVAGVAKVWKTGDASGNPFTADVTLAGGLFVTSTLGGLLEIYIGYDETP